MDVLTERTPRVVSAVKLQRSSERRKTGLFLAEGPNAVEAALATGRVVELFHTASATQRYPELVVGNAHEVTDRAMERLAETVTPSGLVAVCRQVSVSVEAALGDKPRLIAIPERISEPGNAGTLIRIADAVGADAVVFAGESVDPHNGKCVRASAGSLFHVPIARDADIPSLVDKVHARGLTVVVASGDGDLSLDDADDVLAGDTAWVFGNEAHGVSPELAALADHRIRIPIRGRAESLNLATAAAICLYASARVQAR